SNEARDAYRQATADMHNTFSRPIIVYQKSAEAITPDPNYDAFYHNAQQPQVSYTYQTGIWPARIKYLDKQDKEFQLAIASRPNQIELTQETQIIRVKVPSAAYN